MNKEQKEQLKSEFQIHFKDSSDEFGFLIAFIDDLLENCQKELREKIEVKIGKKDFDCREEVFCDLYFCPNCKNDYVGKFAKYCSNCGVKLKWDKE